jgi:hypothetical protein
MASKAAASIGPLTWKLEQLPALTIRAACRGITLTSKMVILTGTRSARICPTIKPLGVLLRGSPETLRRGLLQAAHGASALQIEIRSEWVEVNSVPDNVTRNK